MADQGFLQNRLGREFDEATRWGELSGRLRRFVVRPTVVDPDQSRFLAGAAGVRNANRCSLSLWVTAGHLRATHQEICHEALTAATERLSSHAETPAKQVRNIVSWLESELDSGLLERAYVTASLVLAVADDDVWVWLAGPNGLVCGPGESVRVRSSDLRMPVLRQHGVMPPPARSSTEMELIDGMSSIFCIGTPHGYEEVRCRIGAGSVMVALDRGCAPFGPWPTGSFSLQSMWARDAGWLHGFAANAVAVGDIGHEGLALPDNWAAEEVPLDVRSP